MDPFFSGTITGSIMESSPSYSITTTDKFSFVAVSPIVIT